jgi:F-type H+-transporting ATPase subunit b
MLLPRVAVLLLASFASPALAEAAKPETPIEKEEESAAKKSGLSRYDLGIWTLVVFGALLVLLTKFAWKPIMAGLEKRENTIADKHRAAENARAEAEKLLAEIRAQRAKAAEEIAALLAEARRDADVFREAEKARTAGDIQADRDRLKREIEVARDQALAEIWEKTVQLSTLVSTKAIGRAISADDHRRLIDESLNDLQQRISARA